MAGNTFPIVGAFYRPPAKALIEALAVGTPLMLLAEPENEFDKNAVAVWLKSSDIPEASKEKLEESLPPFGFDMEKITAQDSWHLGYIPKEMAAMLRSSGAVGTEEPVNVTFSTSTTGAPRVRFEEAPF